MAITLEIIKDLWGKEFRTIPRPLVIFDETVRTLNLDGRSKGHVSSHYGDELESMMDTGWALLKPHRARAMNAYLITCWRHMDGYEHRARELFREAVEGGKGAYERILLLVSEVLGDMPAEVLEVMAKSLTNSSRKRAGVHMERSMGYLFRRAGLRFDTQKPKGADFVLPDLRTFEDNQKRSVIVTAKHTIAERWKQVQADIKAIGANHFLATMDRAITPSLADTIRDRGITLYLLPKEARRLASKRNVHSLNALVRDVEEIIGRGGQSIL